MDFKPFSIHVGYDTRVTEYEIGKRGKGPTDAVINWLAESNIKWHFEWQYPEATDPGSVFSIMEFVEIVNQHQKKSGGIFYFDNEEDKLLFCLKWLTTSIEEPLMWHPV